MRPLIQQEEQIRKCMNFGISNMSTEIVDSSVMKIIEDNNLLYNTNKSTLSQTLADVVSIKPTLATGAIENSVSNVVNIFSNFKFDMRVFETIKTFNMGMNSLLDNNIRTIIGSINLTLISAVQSPIVQWLQTFDFTPIRTILESLNFDDDLLSRHRELNEAYLKAMYECKWFPYAGWISDVRLFSTISEIISTSRGASKRREKRIDAAILSYYTKAELKNIKREWKNTELEPHIKKILGQAIEAHIRGEYVLTISCLATMWEGMIKSKFAEIKKPTKEDFKNLVDNNGFDEIFSDFYNNMIISTCYSDDEVIEGIPNRHGVAHSRYVKYPNKKASLNAILLTDFIINLKPKEVSEEI